MGESRVPGDSAASSLLLDDHAFSFELVPAPSVGADMKYIHGSASRPIRMYTDIDSRFILEDFFSKINNPGASSGVCRLCKIIYLRQDLIKIYHPQRWQ